MRSSLFALALLAGTVSARRAVGSIESVSAAVSQYTENIVAVVGPPSENLQAGGTIHWTNLTGNANAVSFKPGVYVITSSPPAEGGLWTCLSAKELSKTLPSSVYVCGAYQNGQPVGTPILKARADDNCIFKYSGSGAEVVAVYATKDASNKYWDCSESTSQSNQPYDYFCMSNGTLIEQPKKKSRCIAEEKPPT